jgi:hypothetical protein
VFTLCNVDEFWFILCIFFLFNYRFVMWRFYCLLPHGICYGFFNYPSYFNMFWLTNPFFQLLFCLRNWCWNMMWRWWDFGGNLVWNKYKYEPMCDVNLKKVFLSPTLDRSLKVIVFISRKMTLWFGPQGIPNFVQRRSSYTMLNITRARAAAVGPGLSLVII